MSGPERWCEGCGQLAEKIGLLKAHLAQLEEAQALAARHVFYWRRRTETAEQGSAKLEIRLARADGALADAETVATGDIERGIRALTAERDGLRGALARLVAALDACEATRGRFSCAYPHDNRCPKARADRPEQWRGIWQCECGAEELEAAVDAARPRVVGGKEETEGRDGT